MPITEVESLIGRVAETIGPKVVGIGRFGSGVVIGDGEILTNAHVVRREEVRVTFADGRTEPGTVSGAGRRPRRGGRLGRYGRHRPGRVARGQSPDRNGRRRGLEPGRRV